MLPRNKTFNKTFNSVPAYRGEDADHRAAMNWHRTLGPSFPCCDLDSVIIEYHYGRPCALVEMKSYRWKFTTESFNTKAVSWLASMAGIPAFITRVDKALMMVDCWPINDLAKAYVEEHDIMNAKAYVRFLNKLREAKAVK